MSTPAPKPTFLDRIRVERCEVCGDRYLFPISAALCCDALTNDLATEDPGIALGYD